MQVDNDLILVGLHGPRGSGKSTLATELAPPGRMGAQNGLFWSHLNFAMPLRELVKAKMTTEGYMAQDRVHYQVHSILVDVLGGNPLFGAPSYDELIQLVYEIAEYDLKGGDRAKAFMQTYGEGFRQRFGQDVWVDYIKKLIIKEMTLCPPDAIPAIVISDVRHENEMEFIKKFQHSSVVKIKIETNTLLDRLVDRDGRLPSEEERTHTSEIFKPSDDLFDLVVDSTYNTPTELADQLHKFVTKTHGVEYA